MTDCTAHVHFPNGNGGDLRGFWIQLPAADLDSPANDFIRQGIAYREQDQDETLPATALFDNDLMTVREALTSMARLDVVTEDIRGACMLLEQFMRIQHERDKYDELPQELPPHPVGIPVIEVSYNSTRTRQV
jgi:hypothetical protein